MDFKYSLDSSSKKFPCPSCAKITFVYYKDNTTGKYLDTHYGRCDREQKCSYHLSPPKGKKGYSVPFLSLKRITEKAFKLTSLLGHTHIVPASQVLKQLEKRCYISEWFLQKENIHYLDFEYLFFDNEGELIINEIKSVPVYKEIPMSLHSSELHHRIIVDYNNQPFNDHLTSFLIKNFSLKEVQRATQDYYLTGTNYFWNNATIFWQIDVNHKVRAGKIMLYNIDDGKRVKSPYNHINWLHKALKELDFNLTQCLFGLHLLSENYSKDVAIVESEKTAILMSIFLPNFIWLATGSRSNFKHELLVPLKKKRCYAFPDKGEFETWKKTADTLKEKGYSIAVSNILERTDFKCGFDLADYFLLDHVIR